MTEIPPTPMGHPITRIARSAGILSPLLAKVEGEDKDIVMTVADRTYSWDDEARVIVSPREPNIPRFHADLAACVRRAIEVAEDQPAATSVAIEHASGFIEIDEIRRMAADSSLPPETAGNQVDTASRKP